MQELSSEQVYFPRCSIISQKTLNYQATVNIYLSHFVKDKQEYHNCPRKK